MAQHILDPSKETLDNDNEEDDDDAEIGREAEVPTISSSSLILAS